MGLFAIRLVTRGSECGQHTSDKTRSLRRWQAWTRKAYLLQCKEHSSFTKLLFKQAQKKIYNKLFWERLTLIQVS